jgi:CRISPR-associated protein Cas6
VGIHPICGQQIGNRQISLTNNSRLALRTTDDKIAALIQLAGKRLNVAGCPLRIGVPQVYGLTPAPALRSRLVTTKNGLDQNRFLQEVRRQLDALNILSEVIVTVAKRRTVRIHDKEVVGYEVIIEGLTAEESVNLQERGLGGRRHMGCGVFVPFDSEVMSNG